MDTLVLAAGEIALLVLGLLLAWRMPRRLGAWLQRAGRNASQFARRRGLAILAAGLFPIAFRIALLPAVPNPTHVVADEFTHLLIAGTLASGRLSNPVHPMRDHFETAYALQIPSYAGIYPPSQGAMIALARVFGLNPWVGIWLSIGVMCAALCWMLQGWFPAPWALMGAVLAAIVLGPWMHSHWGAPVAAAGGALVLGALVRIVRRRRLLDTALFAFGLFILANSRPYEGLLFSLLPCAALARWLFRAGSSCWARAMPLAVCFTVGAGWTMYYNWRVTGDPVLLPYQLYQRQWGVPQSFLFQSPVPKPAAVARYKDLEAIYDSQRFAHDAAASWPGFRRAVFEKTKSFLHFYLHPLMAVPLLFLPVTLRTRRMQFLSGTVLVVLLGCTGYALFFPHYVAPMTAAWVALTVQGIRHLRAWRVGGRRIGLLMVRATAAAVLLASVSGVGALYILRGVAPGFGRPRYPEPMRARAEISESLKRDGGKHLVLVRYRPEHIFHFGVVQNDAGIDGAAVVWARELGPERDPALLRYYANRTVWLFEPDENPLRLTRYP